MKPYNKVVDIAGIQCVKKLEVDEYLNELRKLHDKDIDKLLTIIKNQRSQLDFNRELISKLLQEKPDGHGITQLDQIPIRSSNRKTRPRVSN